MRIEREYRRRQFKILCRFGQAREHCLVSAMDAVEITDGQRDMALSATRKTPEYTHALARIHPRLRCPIRGRY